MAERGAPQTYEITWQSGHIERVAAHQVSWPGTGRLLVAAGMSFGEPTSAAESRIHFHAEIDGQWVLTLSAVEEDIRTIRLVTTDEVIPNG